MSTTHQPGHGSKRAGAARETARTFAVGAACGFFIGAFVVSAVVWQFGDVIGSRTARGAHPANPPAAVQRWTGGVDDVGDAVIRARDAETPVATAGKAAPNAAPPSPSEPVLSAPPADELGDRDLTIPVEGIAENQLVRSFDESRGGRQHEAIDILAPRNTPVRAVEDGTIARLFYSKAGGITIYQFDPTERFCYYYAHLERYADGVAEGQKVRKGQVIGYVGISGNAPKDTPHLHFAIFRLTSAKRWWEGTPIDPYDVLR